MPSYKLTYFDIRGRAEVSRYILAVAGIDYVDERFTEEEWPKIKPTVKNPFKQLPCLEIDGKVFIESLAIENYLAATFGLHGNNNYEKYQIDMVSSAVTDLIEKYMIAAFETDEKRREVSRNNYLKFLPVWLKATEAIFQSNKFEYLVCDRLTLADLQFFCGAEYLVDDDEHVFDNFPSLKVLFDRVANVKEIAEWRNKRPKRDY
ncbi:uncharacterized protein TRIADDRAFT_58007 [Trichoplax adhaerens]|uniref:Glutathione transferase n=1 Tax=Trichoplax adhaerens TaxID=10228 RepID=B3S2F5_TRIAD|nr:hypothetical protein TRIADDRAFT_58007 [Trichoplax adhaerens]EDV23408.1 hypothetical protein TRIADDRAFT_58007 [Trichoplax adhaerens]|eukprot:XP_002114318.1 hypothetical protein TRIADDRAFT_58007 [Trichoplax adhaerens]